MVFPKKKFILVEINHFPGQSVLLKKKENGPVNCFSRDKFTSCVLGPPQKEYFFAVPWRGSFGRILTMQIEPPKTYNSAVRLPHSHRTLHRLHVMEHGVWCAIPIIGARKATVTDTLYPLYGGVASSVSCMVQGVHCKSSDCRHLPTGAQGVNPNHKVGSVLVIIGS